MIALGDFIAVTCCNDELLEGTSRISEAQRESVDRVCTRFFAKGDSGVITVVTDGTITFGLVYTKARLRPAPFGEAVVYWMPPLIRAEHSDITGRTGRTIFDASVKRLMLRATNGPTALFGHMLRGTMDRLFDDVHRVCSLYAAWASAVRNAETYR